MSLNFARVELRSFNETCDKDLIHFSRDIIPVFAYRLTVSFSAKKPFMILGLYLFNVILTFSSIPRLSSTDMHSVEIQRARNEKYKKGLDEISLDMDSRMKYNYSL